MSAICYVIVAAITIGLSAFIILLIGKTGLRDCVISRAPKLISQLFDCDFCLSFWVSLILVTILAIFFEDIVVIFIPLVTTPITRILI